MSTHFIAIDLGATSGRVLHAELSNERIELHELHRFANEPLLRGNGLFWDLPQLWSEVLVGLTRFGKTGLPLAGIGVDTWGVDYAMLDVKDELLGLARHYRDARTQGQLAGIQRLMEPTQLYKHTGIQLAEYNTATQLFAASTRGQDAPHEASKLLLMPDLFGFWLSGVLRSEYTIASTTQLLDARSRCWSPEICTALGLKPSLLPELVQPGTVLGTLRAQLVVQTGLSPKTPIIATASHDTASAVAAVPGLQNGDAFLSSGSWSLLGVELDEPLITEVTLEQNLSNEGGAGGKILLLRNIPGLWVLEECRRQWAGEGMDVSWPALLHLAAVARPFACAFDPEASDFTTPGDMPSRLHAYGRATNQEVPTSIGELVRSYLESLAHSYKRALLGLELALGRPIACIRIVGGGSQNELLNAFTAKACGRPVVAGPAEATALGNVLVQAVAVGQVASLAAGRDLVASSVELRRFAPNEQEVWEKEYVRWCGMIGGK